jgi:hypothetical protein
MEKGLALLGVARVARLRAPVLELRGRRGVGSQRGGRPLKSGHKDQQQAGGKRTFGMVGHGKGLSEKRQAGEQVNRLVWPVS